MGFGQKRTTHLQRTVLCFSDGLPTGNMSLTRARCPICMCHPPPWAAWALAAAVVLSVTPHLGIDCGNYFLERHIKERNIKHTFVMGAWLYRLVER